MEQRGIPTGTLCTDEFGPLARTEAEALGIPTLPIVFLAHPLGGLGREEVRAKADGAIEEVLRVVSDKRETLAAKYRGQYPKQKSIIRPKPMFA